MLDYEEGRYVLIASSSRQAGVTLVEIMVGVAVAALLFATGATNLANWIKNTQIRSTAEAIQSGIQLARAEAIRRNTLVRFQLTSSVDNSCVLSTTVANWVVNMGADDDPSGQCLSDTSIIQKRSASEGSTGVVLAADQSTIIFNGLGQKTTTGNINIDVTNPSGGACAANSGPMTCLRVMVTAGGQVRTCNPHLPSGTPQGC